MIGTTIGHYSIESKLGEGGMGVVYKATDTKLNRPVALKFLPDRVQKDSYAKARFLQEAQAAAGLNHPNICVIHGVEENDGQLFMVMEYVEGGSLAEKLPFAKTEEAVTIGTQIAQALQKAHEKGIVHRDVKADNIMLTADGQAKVMDFGLAKLKGAMKLTRTSSTVGTLGYMAPEQIQGGEVDHRSDIFSFGVLLFEMLTGKLPFRGEHEAAMVYSIVNEEPQNISGIKPDLSPIVVNLIQRCLEKDPSERYQHFDDIVADLKRSQSRTSRVMRNTGQVGAGASTSESHAAEPKPRSARRPLVLIGGLAAFVVIAGLIVAWFVLGESQPRTPAAPTSDRTSLAVMYFDNNTSEEGLGKILVSLLTTNLSRSPSFDVVGSQRLFDILKQLNKQNSATVDRTTATEVATRAGVNTMLMGTIVQIGSAIRITAELLDVRTGNIIASDQVDGRTIEDVFQMVDELTLKVSQKLQATATPEILHVRDVTTSSYEAYEHYQNGLQKTWRWEFESSINDFKQAIEADPGFAMAYFQLASAQGGFLVSDLFENISEVRTLIRKADSLSGRSTDLEKLQIRGTHHFYQREFSVAESLALVAARAYPNDKQAQAAAFYFHGPSNLSPAKRAVELDPTFANAYNALAYQNLWRGDPDAALSAVRKYRALQPDVWNPYDSEWEILMMSGRLDDAIDLAGEALRVNPKWTRFYWAIGYAKLLQDKPDDAREALAKSASSWRVLYTHLYEGRYADALAVATRELASARGSEDTTRSLRLMAIVGRLHALLGDRAQAERTYREAEELVRQDSPGYADQIRLLFTFYRGMDDVAADRLNDARDHLVGMTRIADRYPTDELMQRYVLMLAASLDGQDTAGGASSRSLKITEQAFRIGHPVAIELRALVQAREGRPDEALRLLEALRVNVGSRDEFLGGDEFHFFQISSRTEYQSARICERIGDTPKAIEYFQRALKRWERADKNHREKKDALARLAALTRRN